MPGGQLPRSRRMRTASRDSAGGPELSGHFHPKLRVRVRGKLVSRRCFVATSTKIILPAFGSLTGGLDADHPEIVRAMGCLLYTSDAADE